MREEIITRPSDPLSPAILKLPEDQRYRGDKERIRAYCQQRGYRAVSVVSETTRVPDVGQVDITFRVSLGPKYQVKWLRFEGNRSIRSRELRRHMATKRDTFFTSRRYYDRFFEDDMAALQDYYRFKGFPNATVTYRRSFRGRRRNKVDITIVVVEGQQYPTAAIDVRGNEAVSDETLLAAVPLKSAQAYSDEKLVASREAVERLYKEQGYAYVRVTPNRELTPEGDAYNVSILIEEGDRITINTIRTRGHPRTRREVILREMELQPGMTYDIEKLERSQRALDRLQFFDSVVMTLVPADPPAPGERDLRVDVEEGRTGYLRFGLGFSSEHAIIGAIELTQRNFDWRDRPKSWSDFFSGNAFVGAGQFFRISLFPGTVYSTYAITYNNPYWRSPSQRVGKGFLGDLLERHEQSFGWSVYYRTRDQGEWDEQRAGVRLTRGIRKFKGDPDTDVIFHTRIESVSVRNVDEDEAPGDAVDEEGSHGLLGVGVTVQRDRTDRVVLPTSGYRWDAGAELVVPHGIKLGAGTTRFWPVGKRPRGHERVVSIRGRVDYALGDFPIYERYYAGGSTFRGFEYRGVGPHDRGEPEGGRYRILLSSEYRYPLVANTLYGVVFCDTGTVTKEFSVFGSPRVSVGFGFRLVIPQLSRAPISLDFGFPVLRDGDDDTEIIFFSLSLDR
jgi:outer membrane protein insertion porin family